MLIFAGFSIYSQYLALQQSLEQNTQQSYNYFKQELNALTKVSYSVSNQSSLFSYNIEDNFDYSHNIAQDINTSISSHESILSMGIAYGESNNALLSDMVFTNRGKSPYSELLSSLYEISPDYNDELVSPDIFTFLSNADGDNIDKSLYCVTTKPSPYGGSDALLYFEMDYDYIVNLIDDNTEISSGHFEIYDGHGNLILSSKSDVPSGNYVVEYVFEDITNDCYGVYSVDGFAVYSGLLYLSLTTLLFYLLLLFFARQISMYVARRWYTPLYNLSSLVNDASPDPGEEIVIENTFKYLNDNMLRLTENLSNQESIVTTQIMTALLNGKNTQAIAEQWGEAASIQLNRLDDDKNYCCIVAYIDNYLVDFVQKRSVNQQWIDRLAISNRIKNHVEKGEFIFTSDVIYSTGIIIVYGTDNGVDIQQRALDLCRYVQEHISMQYEFNMTFAVGWHYNNLNSISYSFKDALTFLEYSMFFEQSEILTTALIDKLLCKSNFKKINFNNYIERIIKCIKQQNEVELREALESFFDKFSDSGDMLTVRGACFDLLAALRKFIDKTPIVTPETTIYKLDHLYTRIPQNLKQYRFSLENFCILLMRQIVPSEDVMEKSEKYELILSYIAENLSDTSLCLDSIAEKFSMNASYLTRYFKAQNGEPIMKYVDAMRFNNAKHYLVNTRFSIKDIVRNVGYCDDNNFNRKFKQREGITPQQYRQLYHRDNE